MDFADLLEAVDATYDVAMRPAALPRALSAIGAFLGVRGVHVLVSELQAVRLLAVEEREAPDRARFVPTWCNARLSLALNHAPSGEVFSLRSFLQGLQFPSPDPLTLPWSDCLAAVLPNAALLLAPVPGAESDETDRVAAKLSLLLPHLWRALKLAQRWTEPVPTIAAAARLMRDLPMACILTDSAGRCIESNVAFGAIGEFLGLQIVGGRVRFQDSYLQDSWQSALGETAHTAVGRALLAASSRGRQWKVHLIPVRCQGGDGREAQNLILAVYEEQNAAPAAAPERLAAVGKLTPAELDVLSGLLQGYTGKVIAKSRGASVNTVRSQIMSILSKTGHRSQKELIAAFGASTFDPSTFESAY